MLRIYPQLILPQDKIWIKSIPVKVLFDKGLIEYVKEEFRYEYLDGIEILKDDCIYLNEDYSACLYFEMCASESLFLMHINEEYATLNFRLFLDVFKNSQPNEEGNYQFFSNVEGFYAKELYGYLRSLNDEYNEIG